MTSRAKDPDGITLTLVTTWLGAARQPITPVSPSVIAGALLVQANGDPRAALAQLRHVRSLLDLAVQDQAQLARGMADRKAG